MKKRINILQELNLGNFSRKIFYPSPYFEMQKDFIGIKFFKKL